MANRVQEIEAAPATITDAKQKSEAEDKALAELLKKAVPSWITYQLPGWMTNVDGAHAIIHSWEIDSLITGFSKKTGSSGLVITQLPEEDSAALEAAGFVKHKGHGKKASYNHPPKDYFILSFDDTNVKEKHGLIRLLFNKMVDMQVKDAAKAAVNIASDAATKLQADKEAAEAASEGLDLSNTYRAATSRLNREVARSLKSKATEATR